MNLWQIDIYPAADQVDREAARTAAEIAHLGLVDVQTDTARGFLVQGKLDHQQAVQLARTLLADAITEHPIVAAAGSDDLCEPPGDAATLVNVLPKPGVMDPVAASTIAAAQDASFDVSDVRTFRKYWFGDLEADHLQTICQRVLSNDAIEQVVVGPLLLEKLDVGSAYTFQPVTVPIRSLDDAALERLSREGQLYLTLVEMQTIRQHFETLGRDPSDIELETIAQTWSEHCSHKTLAGRIDYRGPDEFGKPGGDRRQYDNMLKETIFAATQTIRQQLGQDDWCVSVFKDNAGIVTFDEHHHVCFKVETHNHPSALEPYGGANTGIGGVIRDPMGTGMGARPVCNTDVFCFAPPETDMASLPPGVLHPRSVMQGVVAGVRDYGNRMGIPTVNGAVYFDKRYLGNPLVYCGNVGMIPVGMEEKAARPDDLIVAIGGRTGRDGIHGATFSSAELTSESESSSGGAVQIGNAITEKMVLDVLLQARDRGLYNAVTDCGAGGFSSAVGEMGEDIGAEVYLEAAPLKYEGLSYTEIWISEAQERMVLSVAPEQWNQLRDLCESEGVEAAIIGRFTPTGHLTLSYHGHNVGHLSMEFLHGGRPPVIREATYQPADPVELVTPKLDSAAMGKTVLDILASPNVASKHWIIRQYDHEVQGGSVVKPLCGPQSIGPSDAAVVRPEMNSRRCIVLSCGMNPRFGDLDTYHMATSAIDEALRNAVCVGADPNKIAILDNFCWGYTDHPETLGSLVRAAIACQDMAVAMGTPFISGKDSLNNEFSYEVDGKKETIAIPPSLLISAIGQLNDAAKAVTMDLKNAGNVMLLVGSTALELGGSHFSLVHGLSGGRVPTVDFALAKRIFGGIHSAIQEGLIRSCHDLSEGGLAVAAAEMAIAGGLGLQLQIDDTVGDPIAMLFSESNSRFLVETKAEHAEDLLAKFQAAKVPVAKIGAVTPDDSIEIRCGEAAAIQFSIAAATDAWRGGLGDLTSSG
ncbi:MAG: phosphoribosylformylglycinamidine synthase subunit PurL [Planctomycetota bacterium]